MVFQSHGRGQKNTARKHERAINAEKRAGAGERLSVYEKGPHQQNQDSFAIDKNESRFPNAV